jgi:hypothetical protein
MSFRVSYRALLYAQKSESNETKTYPTIIIMVQIDADAPSVVCSGNDIPCCTTVTQDDIDDFSVAATLKQSNVTIKVCGILDIPYFIYVVDKICALQNNPNDTLINFFIFPTLPVYSVLYAKKTTSHAYNNISINNAIEEKQGTLHINIKSVVYVDSFCVTHLQLLIVVPKHS